MKADSAKTNAHDSRESWLRSATIALRPYFESWHGSAADDGNFEIIILADIADPVEVLGVLVHELIHAVLPIDAGHGKLYKEAAIKIGLEGPMRHALPNQLLRPRLVELAESLGALPHARLNIDRGRDNRPADQPKKQRTRLLKAECGGEGCGYTVRITAKWVDDIGPPLCPKHGAMAIERGEATVAESV